MLRRSSWADCISAIPLVPSRSSRRRIHSRTSLEKHWSFVRAMHRLIEKLDDPFCEVNIAIGRDYSVRDLMTLSKQLTETKEFSKKFLTWEWYTRERNPRNALIAELRWQIRERTGKPHDRELRAIIDAAFRYTCLQSDTLWACISLIFSLLTGKWGRWRTGCSSNPIQGRCS
jgi:hypothetical protein